MDLQRTVSLEELEITHGFLAESDADFLFCFQCLGTDHVSNDCRETLSLTAFADQDVDMLASAGLEEAHAPLQPTNEQLFNHDLSWMPSTGLAAAPRDRGPGGMTEPIRRMESASSLTTMASVDSVHSCRSCDISFARSDILRRHEVEKHSTSRPIFVCGADGRGGCGSEFTRMQSLRDHLEKSIKGRKCAAARETDPRVHSSHNISPMSSECSLSQLRTRRGSSRRRTSISSLSHRWTSRESVALPELQPLARQEELKCEICKTHTQSRRPVRENIAFEACEDCCKHAQSAHGGDGFQARMKQVAEEFDQLKITKRSPLAQLRSLFRLLTRLDIRLKRAEATLMETHGFTPSTLMEEYKTVLRDVEAEATLGKSGSDEDLVSFSSCRRFDKMQP